MASEVGKNVRTATATFLFTDIEGSTRLAHALGLERWTAILQTHFDLIRAAVAANGGTVVSSEGDSLFCAFDAAVDGVRASVTSQRAILDQAWPEDAVIRVRMGLHTGEAAIVGEGYAGFDVHRAARIASAGHGGQVLLSDSTQELVQGSLPEGVSLIELGEYRLKDVARPDHIWQLRTEGLQAEFPPLAAIDLAPKNLTARLSNFIGRKKEMGELRRLLAHTRLLTILGPGGAGKTRLATEFARQQASRFADGQVLAELADQRDPALVADAIARAVGIRLQAEDTAGTLARGLQSRQMLLVVDNCEHVVEAAAELVSRLVVACPRLTVLATSRERLNIEGETAWRLPPLALPQTTDSVDAASGAESVRLFVDRARSVRPGFDIDAGNLSAVVAICRRLDGMPLAIELAAARTTTFSAGEIMARLDDRLRLLTGGSRDAEARHRTLRATVDWSYELLDSTERTLFQRLAVFAGPVGADAVQEICGFPPLDPAGVADGLQRLVDRSMLQVEPGADVATRYRLLETIRDYAAAKLVAAGGEAELRDRHLAFYRSLASAMYDARVKRGARTESRRLWAEMPDVRLALDWAGRDADEELELLGNLRPNWLVYAPAEGLSRLTNALSAVEHKPTRGHVRALWSHAALIGRSGRHDLALGSPAELAELSREAGEEVEAAGAYLSNAYVAERALRDLDTAEENLRLAVDAFAEAGYLPDLAMVLSSLGGIEMQRGNLEAARTWVDRGLEVAIQTEDEYSSAGAHYTHGWLEILCGDEDAAQRSFTAALDVVGETNLLAIAEQVEGIAAAMLGTDARGALTLFGAASRLREDVDTSVGLPWSLWVDPAVAEARAALPEAAADKPWESGRAMSTAQVLAMARQAAASRPAKAEARKGAGGLSKRELEVARLVASGMTSPAIAERLFLSERTVESHLEHILTKLGLNSRTQVASWIVEQDPTEDSAG